MDSRPDTFNETVSSILERKVRGWLSTVLDDMRRNSPVQQWLDSLPTDADQADVHDENEQISLQTSDESKTEQSATDNTVVETVVAVEEKLNNENEEKSCATSDIPHRKLSDNVLSSQPSLNTKKKLQRDYSVQSESYVAKMKNPLLRDHSLQSDASGSSGSSVLNVLGARKVDAESVLLALGFGPSEKQQKLQRIPDRFLVPSKLRGISTEKFIKDEQHSMKMHDCGIFGYRGLTGNPHVPPSTIVAKIMECILKDEMNREQALLKTRHSIADMRSPLAVHARLAAHIQMHHNQT